MTGRSPFRSASPRVVSWLRLVFCACALGAVFWSIVTIRDEVVIGPFEEAADRMSYGSRFRPEAIARALPFVEAVEARPGCSRVFRDTAIIRMQAREIAFAAGDRTAADLHLLRAIADFEKDVACVPTRGFSWLMLFATRATRDGAFQPHMPLLAMSYQTGPNEGGFTPLRARAALPLLAGLGPNMTSYVMNDVRGIVRDQVVSAADIYAESSEETRLALAPLLREAPASGRGYLLARLEMLKVDPPAGLDPKGR